MVSFSEESVRAVSMKSSKLTDKRETHTHTQCAGLDSQRALRLTIQDGPCGCP